jgi:hypothetical protein
VISHDRAFNNHWSCGTRLGRCRCHFPGAEHTEQTTTSKTQEELNQMHLPTKFFDADIRIITAACEPLDPTARVKFIEAVGAELQRHDEISDGLVDRICQILQPKFLHSVEQ